MRTIRFVGIIAETKNIPFLKKILNSRLQHAKIIYINNENIKNLKNERFDILAIFNSAEKILKPLEILKEMMQKAKWLILNSDIPENLKLVQNLTLNIITFGFHSKASITTSSIEEGEILVCIQRSIKVKENNIIEPQEIKIKWEEEKLEENAANVMGVIGIIKICDYL